MRIRCGFRIANDYSQPVPMLLALSVHPSREKDLLTKARPPNQPGVGGARLYRRFRQRLPPRAGAAGAPWRLTTEFDIYR